MTHRDPGSVGRPKSSYRIAWSLPMSWSISSSRTTVMGWLAAAAAAFRLERPLASAGVPHTSWRSAATSGSWVTSAAPFASAPFASRAGGTPPSSSMTRAKTCLGSESAMQLTAATRGLSLAGSACLSPPPSLLPSPQHRIIFSACDTVRDLPVPGRPHTYTDPLRRFLRHPWMMSTTFRRSRSRHLANPPGITLVCSRCFAWFTMWGSAAFHTTAAVPSAGKLGSGLAGSASTPSNDESFCESRTSSSSSSVLISTYTGPAPAGCVDPSAISMSSSSSSASESRASSLLLSRDPRRAFMLTFPRVIATRVPPLTSSTSSSSSSRLDALARLLDGLAGDVAAADANFLRTSAALRPSAVVVGETILAPPPPFDARLLGFFLPVETA
mmetsp:Transcript_11144/g.50474  ORF Transcript_11144/g.50474 Transcript_11144/m.50474 type:complete len:386 (+) Transcript_11144:882-2039(+)